MGFATALQETQKKLPALALRKFELQQAQSNFNTRMRLLQERLDFHKMAHKEEIEQAKKENLLEQISEQYETFGSKMGEEQLRSLSERSVEAGGLPFPTRPVESGVTNIAQDLRTEAGMGAEEGLVTDQVVKPPSPADLLMLKEAIKSPKTLEALIAGNMTPEQAQALLAKKWEKTGEKKTAIQKNVPFLANLLGISEKEAAKIVTQSKGKTPGAVYKDFLAASLRSSWDFNKAKQKADQAFEAWQEVAGGKKKQSLEDPLGIR